MPINIYFIRHAESEYNANPNFICGRSNDTPLTENGKRYICALAKYLNMMNIRIDKIYASTAKRAYDTAQICTQEMNLNISIDRYNDLLEMDQGDWSSKPRKEIYTDEILTEIKKDVLNFKAPNGESQKEVADRMMMFLENEIIKKFNTNENYTILIFGHAIAFKCLLQRILCFDPHKTWKIRIDNTSITHLIYNNNDWDIIKINDTSHYLLVKS